MTGEVVLRDGGATARFYDPAGDDYLVTFAVALSAPALDARVEGIVNGGNDPEGARHSRRRSGQPPVTIGAPVVDLAQFLNQLSEDFRGWEGTRRWESLDHDLLVSAEFRDSGRVDLTCELRPWRESTYGRWTAGVTIELEAGEQLRSFAQDIARFFRH